MNVGSFIKKNYIALGLGVISYAVYLLFTFTGNRICDCETTEKVKSGSSRAIYRGGVNRFYHK
jgi:hypothetical protein